MTRQTPVSGENNIRKFKKFTGAFDLTSMLVQQTATQQTKIKYDEIMRENNLIGRLNANDNHR